MMGFGRKRRDERRRKSEYSDPEDAAPGWDAIIATAEAHGLAEPQHFGTDNLPGQTGAYGLNAYRSDDGWLLMTLGLSELFSKESEDVEVSGWGFELTMRLPAAPTDEAPPVWALNLLVQLSEYVYSSSQPFAAGHRMSPGGLITGQPGTRLTALAFAPDPLLPTISTPNGSVEFLAVVGITAEELADMKSTSTADVLDRLREHDPLLRTDAAR